MAPFVSNKKATRLCIAADRENFDSSFLRSWSLEGFDVRYLPLVKDKKAFIHDLEGVKTGLSVSESYAIISFGEAAAVCLEHFLHSPNTSKLCALIAYYPTRIIDPELAYPSSVRVLIHFAAQDVTVVYPSTGRAHKSQREVRRITSAMGTGDRLSVGYQAYVYSGSLPGFAEKDMKQYNHIPAQLAWSRSLKALQLAFHREVDLEAVWDEAQQARYFSSKPGSSIGCYTGDETPSVTFQPTAQGASGGTDLRRFYENNFGGNAPTSMRLRLLSRTTGADRVVEELYMSFKHSQEMPWILPGVAPTHKQVEVILISITRFIGGKISSENVYWDQASVLCQVGLIDPGLVPQGVQGVQRIPVTGREEARTVLSGST
ncbi:hypothetical protein ASPSYDRAFT_69446 [Aspergillus sydowii CBS 593.65]|jgi:hypothetical protein|uniref:SnoaL-like domain-containing protein n=1 Tax=Aspergillus sydowii CBS 593.65 TaxID=1036612 RepID=A0A1L9TFZ2_9EURO|nr:uncharacterized protein ASPSYDRAFT_69446 [Aspergillus sydowii CBS 593.65]OJJ58354.1 hypothetical protein ASPSYDRAFT_69446 [Aspergillus sydowii CBS 593.65]